MQETELVQAKDREIALLQQQLRQKVSTHCNNFYGTML